MTGPGGGRSLEFQVGRLLTLGTYAAITLIAIGVALMAATGRSPLDASAPLDLGRLAGDLAALRPEGFLWLGLLLVLATPSTRVLVSLGGYVRAGEREMAVVAALILAVIALGVAAGTIEG